jgi:hypothetical protein
VAVKSGWKCLERDQHAHVASELTLRRRRRIRLQWHLPQLDRLPYQTSAVSRRFCRATGLSRSPSPRSRKPPLLPLRELGPAGQVGPVRLKRSLADLERCIIRSTRVIALATLAIGIADVSMAARQAPLEGAVPGRIGHEIPANP